MNETVLQFGSGKFLRAFADLFVHHANQQGQNIGKIVIVQSTGESVPTNLPSLVANTMWCCADWKTAKLLTGLNLAKVFPAPLPQTPNGAKSLS